MKSIKGISIVFGIILVLALGLGAYYDNDALHVPSKKNTDNHLQENSSKKWEKYYRADLLPEHVEETSDAISTSSKADRLTSDTKYLVEEVDVLHGSSIETEWSLPAKYIGMNREAFLDAMDYYRKSPPLAELERGFQTLEVLSFSPEKVQIRVSYRYVQPGDLFYLAVYKDELVVYLEDRETIYLYTGISPDQLPEDILQMILQGYCIGTEEKLYRFLESYSS